MTFYFECIKRKTDEVNEVEIILKKIFNGNSVQSSPFHTQTDSCIKYINALKCQFLNQNKFDYVNIFVHFNSFL